MRRCSLNSSLLPSAAVLLCACFNPELPEGLPCSETGGCPPQQRCLENLCVSTSSSNRADGGIDADVPDAMSCDSGTATIYYPDADADGFGGSAAVSSCEPLEGYVLTSGDCWDADDSNAAWAYPGQTSYFTAPMEVQNNAFDWNCDGQESYLHQECTTSFHPSCITPSKFGWLDSFPECGVTQNWCNSWDAEASNCLDSESRIQACN